MNTFKEWLAEQATKQGNGVAERKKRVSEWIDTVASLFAQIRQWLAEDDTQQVLLIEPGKTDRAEEGMGMYEVATLRLSLGGKTVVDLIPLARNVMSGIGRRGDPEFRAEGRVDMTNGGDKYMLYHVAAESEKKWVIVDDHKYSVKDLNKETFEEALQDLLS